MHWRQYQRFEQRGDLEKQAEGLRIALGQRLPSSALQEVLQLARQSAAQAEQKQPAPVIAIQDHSVHYLHPTTGEILNTLELPREAGQKNEQLINWSHFNGSHVMGMDNQGNQLIPKDRLSSRDLPVPGLRLNSSYAYLSFGLQGSPRHLPPHKSYLCKQWLDPRIPLENLRSRPYDLFATPQHPYFVVSDRSAGKLHFIQRNPLKLLRSWPLVQAAQKKILQTVFHPDGKQVYVSSYQKGAFHVIDRGMAQKRIQLSTPGLVSNLKLSNRGDLLYLYVMGAEDSVEIWVLDTLKYQKQAVYTLEGSAFSAQTDPQDLFEISPDGKYLLTLVSRNRPNLFSPYLLQIEAQTGQVIHETLLKPEEKPLQLAFQARELTPPRIRLLPLLAHGGYGLNEADIQAAFAP